MNPLTEILNHVSDSTGIPIAAIRGRGKTAAVCRARFATVALMHLRFPWWSQSELAAAIGRNDHGTAANALSRAAELCEKDENFARMIES